jgi:glycosyltransferase involved in cell wall biosynthesis
MRKDSPLVSICCVTYNHRKYIGNAIEGFLMQKTNFAIEIIIHDDASTDGTIEILLSYKERFPDLIQLRLEDENQYSRGARPYLDLVLPYAKGKYIAFCDGDDFWTDDQKIQKQVQYLEAEGECVGVSCYTETLYEPWMCRTRSSSCVGYLHNISSILNGVQHGLRLSSLVYRRERLIRSLNGLRVTIASGDLVMLYSILKNGGFIYLMPFIGVVYRVHDNGVWSSLKGVRWRQNVQENFKYIYQHILLDRRHRYKYSLTHIKVTAKFDIRHLHISYFMENIKYLLGLL